MSANAGPYEYEPDFLLADDISFTDFIQSVNAHAPTIRKQLSAQWNGSGYTKGRQLKVPVRTSSHEPYDVQLKLLGMGQNGIAYKVALYDRVYVLKMLLNHDATADPLNEEIEILKALKDKWFALQLLASSALPTKDNSGDDAFNIYMLYPYIEGRTLHSYKENLNSNNDNQMHEMRERLNDILEGLHELHLLGIAHNDIKLENIWIPTDSTIRPFFIDFGMSGIFTEKRKPSVNYAQLYNTISGFKKISENVLKTLRKKNVTYNNIKNMKFGGKRSKRTQKKRSLPHLTCR